MHLRNILFLFLTTTLLLVSCQPPASPGEPAGQESIRVLAAEPFLADITRAVAGERTLPDALVPYGIDPHAFEPTPRDIARVTNSNVLVVNGAGFEPFLEDLLAQAEGERLVIDASAGLAMRTPGEEEALEEDDEDEHEGDPHFWLDPNNVVQYTRNIQAGLSRADPDGAAEYAANADAYISRLAELDKWIKEQVAQIPPDRRLLVTNHESLGYFADRYGFRIVGTVIPSLSTSASPSAQEMAGLVEAIRASGAPAIFLETGANPRLAEQIAAETGVKVAPGLHTHSPTPPGGPAPTYLDMMRYNTQVIVDALR